MLGEVRVGRSGGIWGCFGVFGGVELVEKNEVAAFWELILKWGGIMGNLGMGL